MNDVLRRIGGPDSVTITGYVVLAIVMYLAALTSSRVDLNASFLSVTAASILSLSITFAWLWFAKHTLLKLAKERPLIARTMTVFVVAFVLRAATFDVLLMLFGATTSSNIWYRLLASLPTFGFGLPLVAYIMSLLGEFSRKKAMGEALAAEASALLASTERRVGEHREQLQQFVHRSLTRELEALVGDAPPSALQRLRDTIAEIVRPVSHELVTTVPEITTSVRTLDNQLRWGEVAKQALMLNPVHPLPFAAWMGIIGFSATALTHTTSDSLLFGFGAALLSWLLLVIARFIWSQAVRTFSLPARVVAFITTYGVFTVITFYAIEILFPMSQPGNLLSNAMTVFILGWLVAMSYALRTELERASVTLDALNAELAELVVKANTMLREQQLALSKALHGPVQDELTAAAIRLANAISNDTADVAMVADVQRSVMTSLRNVAEVEPRQVDLKASIMGLVELWRGVVNIELMIDDAVEQSLMEHPATANTVAEIVREGCANAIRHGQASNVLIRVVFGERQGTIWVEVVNDGLPVTTDDAQGVGSVLLSELTLEWSRDVIEDQTRLRALVPLA